MRSGLNREKGPAHVRSGPRRLTVDKRDQSQRQDIWESLE